MEITKPILIKKDETNKVVTSSGEFLEYISWKQCRELGVGIAVHRSRFPASGILISKKVNEIVMLLEGSGSVVVDGSEFVLEKEAVMFIPKGSSFYFEPSGEMKILSMTGPAWFPRQQKGLDYRRKESGRLIL